MAKKESKREPNSTIVRVHKNSNFTVMSNRHLLFEKPPMSLKAKGLLSMFLALPPEWNYSINGIVSISKESRDCIRSTIAELTERGYLNIEKQKAENGRFIYIYHIFDEPQSIQQPDTENPHLENPTLEDQDLENPHPENPTQLNINEINIDKVNTNKFTIYDLFNLYKEICKSYPQPREFDDDRKKKAAARIKLKPDKEYWQTIFEKAEKSDFCQQNSFFNFDWVTKNNANPRKVYEGNYDNKNYSNNTSAQNFLKENNGKYSNYHSKQGGIQ